GAFHHAKSGQHGSQLDAAAGQALLEEMARPSQPAPDGALLNLQFGSGLRPALGLQDAQHKRRPEGLAQPLNLLIQAALHIAPRRADRRLAQDGPKPCLTVSAPCCAAFDFHGGPIRRTVQPRAERLALADRRGFPRQDQEGSLESVLGVLLMLQGALAY